MKLLIKTFAIISVYLGVGALSGLIYGNVFEGVTSIDLPKVGTVVSTDLPKMIVQVGEQIQSGTYPKDYGGFFGAPKTLRLPKLGTAVSLHPYQKEGDRWLVHNNYASFYPLGEQKGGRLGNTLIFGKSESLYLQPFEGLVEGDRLVLETDNNWRYHYRVEKRILLDHSDRYLVSDSPSNVLVILKEITGTDEVLLIEASFLSLEEMINLNTV